jgi:hypothetical protein
MHMVDSGEVRDVTVTYRVTKRIPDGNAITFRLPDDWRDKDGNTDFGTMGDLTRGNFTSLATDGNASTDSYVTVNTPYTSATAASLTATLSSSAGNDVVVTVGTTNDPTTQITMTPGNRITVTYHNVKVQEVTEAHFAGDTPAQPAATDGTETRNPVGAQLSVSDTRGTVTGSGATATYDSTATTVYASKTLFKVSPPELSRVTVTDRTADSEEVRDVKVTYRVRARIEGGNVITIGLPTGWGDKDGSVDSSADFGDLGDAPTNGDFTSFVTGTTASTDSYVTVDTPYASAVADGLTVTGTLPEVVLTVVEDPSTDAAITMMSGNIITVTYHNVKVKKLLEADFTGADPAQPAATNTMAATRNPVDAQVSVEDTIVRSDTGIGQSSSYNSATTIAVSPPELSKVTVTDPRGDRGAFCW